MCQARKVLQTNLYKLVVGQEGKYLPSLVTTRKCAPVGAKGRVALMQQRPYTGVYLELHDAQVGSGKMYEATAFSKVCYPDKWDEQYGVSLCLRKACANISRQIMQEIA